MLNSEDAAVSNEFQVISYKRSKNRNKKVFNLNSSIKAVNCDYFNLESTLKRIEIAKEDVLISDLYSSLLASLREGLDILHNPEIKEIVCFGLGRIGECMIARYQLALLICLRDLYTTKCYVYDPIFNENELKLLRHYNIEILLVNQEGKYQAKQCSSTIFFLPHCPKQLSNNLLWANWGLELHNCIIIANSFTQIIETNSKRIINANAEYICKAYPHFNELAVINTFKYYDIFNNLAIHIFPWENLSLISKDFWKSKEEPNYRESDVEFITKAIEL